MKIEPIPFALLSCSYCNLSIDQTDDFCQQCGFPLKGSEEEITQFYYKMEDKRIQLDDANKIIRKAMNSLYVIAGVFAIYGSIYYFIDPDNDNAMPLLATNGILAVIFLLLAFWSKQKPVGAIISALLLYGAVQLLNFIVEPASLFYGIIIKVAVIIYLIKGLQSALAADKIRNQLNIS